MRERDSGRANLCRLIQAAAPERLEIWARGGIDPNLRMHAKFALDESW
jgi:hypothetical protein